MRTRLTDLLDIEHPIMLAGMGGVSYHRLVAAVSEAGGIGTLGASTMSATELPEEMAKVRELTAKPFGVDLLTAMPGQVEQGIDDVIKGGARIFVAGLGVPRDAVDALHDNNVLVGSMCGKVRHAVNAVASGCDFVVAQGTEAGGHTGTVATMALVPQVVDAVDVPVIAAGGIADDRGIAAAFMLGASGVQIGSAYLLCPEATISELHRAALRSPDARETALTNVFTGRPARSIVTRLMREVGPLSATAPRFPRATGAVLPLRGAAEPAGDTAFTSLWSGQAVALATALPAGELTRRLATATLERLP